MTMYFLQTLAGLLTTCLLLGGFAFTQELHSPKGSHPYATLELTSFRLVEGADETAFLAAAQHMQEAFLNQQPGFINRTLVKGETGWTDVVYWKDPQSIQVAMQQAESSPDAAAFMQMIDFDSVKMNLSEIKLDTH